jgi:hypothetical protein
MKECILLKRVVLGVSFYKLTCIKKLRISRAFSIMMRRSLMAISDITELLGALTGLATVIAPVVVVYLKSRKKV